MEKDFDTWNHKKKELDARILDSIPLFKEGEIWWTHLGVNVGFEMDGKGKESTRPVLIIKKYNKFSFLALPLSTSPKANKYRVSVGIIDGKDAAANVSQIKNIDSKRLAKKICTLERGLFENVKQKTSQINFS